MHATRFHPNVETCYEMHNVIPMSRFTTKLKFPPDYYTSPSGSYFFECICKYMSQSTVKVKPSKFVKCGNMNILVQHQVQTYYE